MRQEREQLATLLDDLRRGKIARKNLYHAIHEFGKQNFIEAEQEVEHFLKSDDVSLRAISLQVLAGHWGLTEYCEIAWRVLETDEDEECRFRAASIIGAWKRNTQDKQSLLRLSRVVRNDQEDNVVRESAYAAMKAIVQYNPREQIFIASLQFNFERDVDWRFVNSYLEDSFGDLH